MREPTTRLRVKGWASFQHYKDRSPPWIKFYRSLLEDIGVATLRDHQKAHLFGIWLLAASNDGEIPADAVFVARRINATVPVDLDALVDAGFLEEVPAKAVKPNRADGWESRYISEAVRAEVRARDKVCQMCGATEELEYDHRVPVSLGGNGNIENVQLLCRPCNRKKRALAPDCVATCSAGSGAVEQSAPLVEESRVEKRQSRVEAEQHPPAGLPENKTPPEPRDTAPAIQVAQAANRGAQANPLTAAEAGLHPLTPDRAQQAVTDWLAAGIPLALVLSVVEEVAKRYTPAGTKRRITSFKYFDAAVREAHAAGQPGGDAESRALDALAKLKEVA